MAKDKNITNKKTLLQKLRYKYRLIILNEDTFEQKTSMRLSRMNLYVLASVFFLLVVIFVTTVIAFTPLKYYMPGVGSVDVRTQLIEVEMLTDSIQKELDKRNLWLQKFQMALSGDLDSTFFASDSLHSLQIADVDIDEVSSEELAFREEIEEELDTEVDQLVEATINKSDFYALRFISPAEGVVVGEYNAADGHYGIDIAGKENENIMAVESGVVLLADWNPETGHVIAIQHKNNTISFYKHNAVLLKKVGSFVSRGEVIALMGNSGHLSDGQHLHFELWRDGKAVNPAQYLQINKIEG